MNGSSLLRRFEPVWLLSLAGLLAGQHDAARADIYKYVDGSGHVHYTDNPSHSGFKLLIRTPTLGRIDSFAPPPEPRAHAQFAQFKTRYATAIEETATRYRLDPALLHAVVHAESGYNPNAVSPKGAVGLMQLMPATAARYGVDDRRDPLANLEGGARYLSDLLDLFGDDVRLAVAAYNAGENAVIKSGSRIPPYAETQQYVSRVMHYYRRAN